MPRFSVRWLLWAVAFVGAAIAGLLNANWYWHRAFESLGLVFVLTAVAAAIYSNGKRRAFWVGCLLFGGPYFLLSLGFVERYRWGERFITTVMLEYMYQSVFEPHTFDIPPEGGRIDYDALSEQRLPDGTLRVFGRRPSWSSYSEVGNAVLCIPFALFGGALASWFYRRPDQGET